MTWIEKDYALRRRNRSRRHGAALLGSALLHLLALVFLVRHVPRGEPETPPAEPRDPAFLEFVTAAPEPPPSPPRVEVVPEPPPPDDEPPPAEAPERDEKPPEPPEKEKPFDPFSNLPSLWWQRESVVHFMGRMRRGVVDPDSSRVPLVRPAAGARELATLALNARFRELQPVLRAERAREQIRESFPYLDE